MNSPWAGEKVDEGHGEDMETQTREEVRAGGRALIHAG